MKVAFPSCFGPSLLRAAVLPLALACLPLHAQDAADEDAAVVSNGPTPREALLVGEKNAGLLTIIDPDSLKVVAKIPVGNQPHEVASTGNFAYISNSGAGAMTVVDVANQRRVAPVEMGALGSLHGMATAGGKVYISHENSRILSRYNPEEGRIDWEMGVGFGSHLIQVTPDEQTIFLASNGAQVLSVIQSNQPISSSIATGGRGGGGGRGGAGRGAGPAAAGGGRGPGGGAPGGGFGGAPAAQGGGAPGGADMAQGRGGPGGAAAGPGGGAGRGGRAGGGGGFGGGRGGLTINTIPSGPRVEGFDISPDGQEFWAVNVGDSTVTIASIPDNEVLDTITLDTDYSNRLQFTPDGRYVFFSQLRQPELMVFDARTHQEVKRIDVGAGGEGIFMDPHGGRAFYAVSSGNKVAVIDLATLTVSGYIEDLQNPDGMAWYTAE